MTKIDPGKRRQRLFERLEALRERASLLEAELHTYTSDFFRVCIFGSARIKPDDDIYKITERLGYLLGSRGIDVLTGGGPGLMEAANKGVTEGRRSSGSRSRSFGISIALNQNEPLNDHLDAKHHHKKFSSRLDEFMRLSNAIVVMPGGIGTLLELLFSWQLIQVGHIAQRPIILVGANFWSGLVQWVKSQLLSRELICARDISLVVILDTAEEVTEMIEAEYDKFKKINKKT